MPHTECAYRELIERGLHDHLPESRLRCADHLNHALRYAMFPGGKRTRPWLTLLAANAVGGCEYTALPAACAVEFLHASSLIFDDLPAMDNADLRRGKLSLHAACGEDIALLAALALLNQAYAIFGRWPLLLSEAVEAIGENGMIGGQAVDLLNTSAAPSAARNRKTSALMRLTLVAGALAVDADPDSVAVLATAGESLGEAYQICDDLLDAYLDCGATGKTERQDARNGRASHASAFAADVCQAQAFELVNQATESIERHFGANGSPLVHYIKAIASEFGRAGLVAA